MSGKLFKGTFHFEFSISSVNIFPEITTYFIRNRYPVHEKREVLNFETMHFKKSKKKKKKKLTHLKNIFKNIL